MALFAGKPRLGTRSDLICDVNGQTHAAALFPEAAHFSAPDGTKKKVIRKSISFRPTMFALSVGMCTIELSMVWACKTESLLVAASFIDTTNQV